MNQLHDFFARWVPRKSRAKLWDKPVTDVLSVHPRTFEITCAAFAGTRVQRLECGLFWYGKKLQIGAVEVAAIVVPKQRNYEGFYLVEGDAIEEMSDHTRGSGWINLAQVHTHPSAWVGHSTYDDEHTNSRNALSIVMPHYGKPATDWFKVIGVHEFLDKRWRHLTLQRARQRIQFDPNCTPPKFIDLRVL